MILATAFLVHGAKWELAAKGYVVTKNIPQHTVTFAAAYTKKLSENQILLNGMEDYNYVQGNLFALMGCKLDKNENYIAKYHEELFEDVVISNEYLNIDLTQWEFGDIIEEAKKYR